MSLQNLYLLCISGAFTKEPVIHAACTNAPQDHHEYVFFKNKFLSFIDNLWNFPTFLEVRFVQTTVKFKQHAF